MEICPVTGRPNCYCEDPDVADCKGMLRYVFNDHAIYTNWAILAAFAGNSDESSVVNKRLLENPQDTCNVIEANTDCSPVVLNEIKRQLTAHLKLAVAAVVAVISGKKQNINRAVKLFKDNATPLGEAFNALNPGYYPQGFMVDMWKTHVDQVVNLVLQRNQGKFADYQELFDVYRKHMVEMSDSICAMFE